ncbi:hypothetical protein MBRA_54360 (plasmid) [Mycobacterium branderi]|uniref:Uncharacterized protein n=1 Tax=Mycobacterium branderi TaxID=43348 RepID=A0ABN6BFA3_9MYCO|nr:hypothetical protein MBRA_54360 [Mycobacterium branderi]
MGIDRPQARGKTKVGQARHAAHGMSHKRQPRFHVQGREDIAEISAEPLNSVGMHWRARGFAVAAMVVGDDANIRIPLAEKLGDLDVPRVFIQRASMKKHDGVGGAASAVFTDRQSHPIAGRYCVTGATNRVATAIAQQRCCARAPLR